MIWPLIDGHDDITPPPSSSTLLAALDLTVFLFSLHSSPTMMTTIGPGDPLSYSHCGCLKSSLATSGAILVSRRAAYDSREACYGLMVWRYTLLVDRSYDREYNITSVAKRPKIPCRALAVPVLNVPSPWRLISQESSLPLKLIRQSLLPP